MVLLLLESWIHLIHIIMISVYNIDINNEAISKNLTRIQSQIFKLLPMREEAQDWTKPLETIILELLGMQGLFPNVESLIALVCKLQGLIETKEEDNFLLYRRTIFECCGLIDKVRTYFQ